MHAIADTQYIIHLTNSVIEAEAKGKRGRIKTSEDDNIIPFAALTSEEQQSFTHKVEVRCLLAFWLVFCFLFFWIFSRACFHPRYSLFNRVNIAKMEFYISSFTALTWSYNFDTGWREVSIPAQGGQVFACGGEFVVFLVISLSKISVVVILVSFDKLGCRIPDI